MPTIAWSPRGWVLCLPRAFLPVAGDCGFQAQRWGTDAVKLGIEPPAIPGWPHVRGPASSHARAVRPIRSLAGELLPPPLCGHPSSRSLVAAFFAEN